MLLLACAANETSAVAEERRWPSEKVSGTFHLHADFPLQDRPTIETDLVELRHEVTTRLNLPSTRDPIHLFLFSEPQTYQAYLRIHYPNAPARRALYIKEGRGPGMVFAYVGEDFTEDIRHECTHAILHTALPQLPLWLDEGLAEYFELPRSERSEPHTRVSTIKALAQLGELPRFEDLEGMTSLEQLGQREYREAWAWVAFCLDGPPEASRELQLYLTDLAEGNQSEPLSRRLQRRVPRLGESARSHFVQLR